ncbi:hypothetical protein [Actinomadura rayongensis]|uniref:Uncharacterized protein n=1 Tax=Actinomadura rayongensis TaxID=1429076 RepID=A0A6I4WAP4_9ACTN|nr:hypothetical protein [Actinomadura rayongensis]MXQ66728.1 hypothetical protein [Actinomadura rayongensis]
MHCPTCGTSTPGTLGACPRCNTPLAGAPLGAPVLNGRGASGTEDGAGLGDGTVLVPPPPSWAPAPPDAHANGPAAPPSPFAAPPNGSPASTASTGPSAPPNGWGTTPATAGASFAGPPVPPNDLYAPPAAPHASPSEPPHEPGAPLNGLGAPPAGPPNGLGAPPAGPLNGSGASFGGPGAPHAPLNGSGAPSHAPLNGAGAPPAGPLDGPGASFGQPGAASAGAGAPFAGAPGSFGGGPQDPESTAAWTFDPDAYDDEDDDVTHRAAPPSAPPAPPAPPARPAWAEAQDDAGPAESIVPESWYAKPRRPSPEDESDATRALPPSPAPSPWASGADATQIAPGPPHGPPHGPQPGYGPPNGPGEPYGPPNGPYGQPSAGFGPPNAPLGQPNAPYGPPNDPYGPNAPYGGANPPGGGKRGGGTPKPLLVGVAVLVAVAVVAIAVVVWPDGKKDPSGAHGRPAASTSNTPVAEKKPISGPTRQQAAQLNALLNTSGEARRNLTAALAASAKCKTLPAAIGAYQRVAERRQAQLQRTEALKVDHLPNGERMRGYLRQSFQSSLEVDQALLRWAQGNQRKCKGKPRPNAAHAPGRADAERRATQNKQRFVALWNPVARRTGNPTRAWNTV